MQEQELKFLHNLSLRRNPFIGIPLGGFNYVLLKQCIFINDEDKLRRPTLSVVFSNNKRGAFPLAVYPAKPCV
jgi:hypothetical protein